MPEKRQEEKNIYEGIRGINVGRIRYKKGV